MDKLEVVSELILEPLMIDKCDIDDKYDGL